MDRCRTLYQRYLEHMPDNCSAWVKYAQLETSLAEHERWVALAACRQTSLLTPYLSRAVQRPGHFRAGGEPGYSGHARDSVERCVLLGHWRYGDVLMRVMCGCWQPTSTLSCNLGNTTESVRCTADCSNAPSTSRYHMLTASTPLRAVNERLWCAGLDLVCAV